MSSPIKYKNEYDKHYYEQYAKLTLSSCYDQELASLVNKDKPDLQSDELSIGIEVSRSVSSESCHQQFIINKYFGKGYTPEYIIEQAKKEKKYGDIFKDIDGLCVAEMNFNTNDIITRTMFSIHEKTIKLNSDYKLFNSNWLYLFLGTSMVTDQDIKTIVDYLKNSDYKEKSFDKIFINTIDRIFVINSNFQIDKIEVSEEQLKLIKSQALSISKQVNNHE